MLILLSYILFSYWLMRTNQKKAKRRKQVTVTICKPSAAEIRRAERAQQDRQLAAADVDRCQAQKETLMRLLDSIEAELQTTTEQKRITVLLTKQANVENRLYNLDRRLDKAWATAHK